MPVKVNKHKESGIGFCFAIIQTVAFFLLWPKYTELIWPSLMAFKENYQLRDFVWASIVLESQFFLLVVGGNIFYFTIYAANLPFFEKYKALEDPWPWESDPE